MSNSKKSVKKTTTDFDSMSPITLCPQRSYPESLELQDTSSTSLIVNFDERSIVKSETSICSDDKSPQTVTRTRSSTSRYMLHGRPRVPPSTLNNFLDFLSMCFWKCSPGCQQLPDNKKV